MNPFRLTVPLLALNQALMMSATSLLVATCALVGFSLATDKALATLPIAALFIATMLTSIPAALLMNRIGRKHGFMLAALIGASGAVTSTIAIIHNQFWLFVAGTMLIGVFNGFGNYFRFTAADSVDTAHKSRAISYVMAGGVVAAFVGPNLATITRNLVSQAPFAASYAALVLVYLCSFISLWFISLPLQADSAEQDTNYIPRPLVDIAKQAKFIVALTCGMLGYGIMSLIMTATPLAMNHHEHNFSDTSFVIQWHIFAMFAPSFVTGHLIRRFGVTQILFTGVLMGISCVTINLLGNSVNHFWLALILLGICWNFLFIGATTLLTETYHTKERSKTQATNDFAVFTTVAISSLFAGSLNHNFGWQAVNLSVLPLLLIILLSITWLKFISLKEEKRPILVSE